MVIKKPYIHQGCRDEKYVIPLCFHIYLAVYALSGAYYTLGDVTVAPGKAYSPKKL